MSQNEDVSSQPLVIVRRRRNTEEPHHGGVWKIAYADFMTAMMAFFLVMWLINAADKKTIVQVAAYFNPMRLTDRFAAPKGLEDLTETESKQNDQKSKRGHSKQLEEKQKLDAEKSSKENIGEAMDEAAQNTSAAAGGKSSEAKKEQALFDNPGDLLDKLADEAKASQPMTSASPADGNVADPFDRTNRRSGKSQATLKPAPQGMPPSAVKDREAEKVPTQPISKQAGTSPEAAPKDDAKDQKQSPANVSQPDAKASSSKPEQNVPAQKENEKPAEPTVADKEALPHDKVAEANRIESDISSAISQVSRQVPQVEVKSTPEGLLISLIDNANFGMFEVGSAKPRPELVLVMGKIGEVLKSQAGKIVIRGHTDSRAYKSGVYDNWRLSAARAQMAYYMLLRGGIPDSRFVAIEGRADRDPKVPTDTEAAQNRRIDILIKDEKR